MSDQLLAEFAAPDALFQAIDRVRSDGGRAVDAFSPYPLDSLPGKLGLEAPSIRPVMLGAGLLLAALAYGVEWYSAVFGYPINSGGRPLHSWPVFLLVPIEIGFFAAALAGVIAFLMSGSLPRLHHRVFDVPEFERASQDHFFLLAEHEQTTRLRHTLEEAGALSVTELRP